MFSSYKVKCKVLYRYYIVSSCIITYTVLFFFQWGCSVYLIEQFTEEAASKISFHIILHFTNVHWSVLQWTGVDCGCSGGSHSGKANRNSETLTIDNIDYVIRNGYY